MSFNIGHALLGAAESFVTSGGNPIAAAIGGIADGCGGTQQPQSPSIAIPSVDPDLNLLAELAKRDFGTIEGAN